MAVVVFTNYPARPDCVALWQGLGSFVYVAQAVAGNAANEISAVFPNLGNRLTERTTFYTDNAYLSQVVVAKLYYSDITETGIRFMAGALSGAWGLGEVVSEFEPTNNKKRSEASEETTASPEEFSDKRGIISSAPYTQAEMSELHGLMLDMEEHSIEQPDENLHRRAGWCPSTYLGSCRNAYWSPWNTQWRYSC